MFSAELKVKTSCETHNNRPVSSNEREEHLQRIPRPEGRDDVDEFLARFQLAMVHSWWDACGNNHLYWWINRNMMLLMSHQWRGSVNPSQIVSLAWWHKAQLKCSSWPYVKWPAGGITWKHAKTTICWQIEMVSWFVACSKAVLRAARYAIHLRSSSNCNASFGHQEIKV